MKYRVPPAVVLIAHFGFAWLICKYLNIANFRFPGQNLISWIFTFTGITIALLAIYRLRVAKTTIDPISPEKASSLITTGIFGISRNPIYLALLLWLLAWILWLGNALSLFLGVTFVWYLTHFQIRAEEKALENKFAEEYRKYQSKVRRWL